MSKGGIHSSSGISTLNHNTQPVVGWQWWPGHCHPFLLINFSPLLLTQQEAFLQCIPHPCELLSFLFVPRAVSMLLTGQGILYSWPWPGTAIPANLSLCNDAEGLGIYHSFLKRPVCTPLPMGPWVLWGFICLLYHSTTSNLLDNLGELQPSS